MPVHYTGILDEHQAVRTGLGAFDISHMGQFLVAGENATQWLNGLLTNNVERLEPGLGQYTFLTNENGGVIDDLLIYCLAEKRYLLVVNASKIDEDFAWMSQHLTAGVEFSDDSAAYAGIAVQGPLSPQLFDAFFGGKYSKPSHNEILSIQIDGFNYFIARTGYTGEDGFEVFCPADRAVKSWTDILARGAQFGIKPCGLGSRDTLRLEMCYPLNGSDLCPTRTPLEAGLSIFVDLNKGEFIGRDALLEQKTEGIPTRLVPFKMKEKSPPPRPHYGVWKNGEQLGEISSGTLSPSLGVGIGMAYVPAQFARVGEELEIDIRGRRFAAVIERKPLYKKS